MTVGDFTIQCIQDAKLQPVHADSIRQFVVNLLLRDRGLRNAKAAERARRNQVGMHRPGNRPVMRNYVGAGRMHRNPCGHSRSPRGIRARIEVGGEDRAPPVSRSRVAPARNRMRAGWRFVVDRMDSMREYTIRTGWFKCQAASGKKRLN